MKRLLLILAVVLCGCANPSGDPIPHPNLVDLTPYGMIDGCKVYRAGSQRELIVTCPPTKGCAEVPEVKK